MGKHLTRREIAKLAGVSESTVSRALSGSPLIPEKTRDRIVRLSGEMGYKPNVLASRLASNRSFQIGFAVEISERVRRGPIQQSYYSTILDAMVSAALRSNYFVSITPYESDDAGGAAFFADMARARHIDGLIFAGLRQESVLPSELKKRNVPFVLIGSKPADNEILTVNGIHGRAVKELISSARDKGYKRIFYVEGDQEYYHALAQKKALIESVNETGLEIVSFIPGNYSRRSGYEAGKTISDNLQDRDFVFLANDRMASGFYKFSYEKGIRIPEDVGVAGSDDDDSASVLFPELSTIRQPRKEMGKAAVEVLIELLEGRPAKSRLLYQSFVPRNSF